MLILRSIERRTLKLRAALPTAAVLVILGWSGGLMSCGSIEPVAPQELTTDPARLYMALSLDHHAINLSSVGAHRTLQLSATPLDGTGATMTGLPAPTFRSSDTTRVRVTPDGLVEGLMPATGVLVIAELVIDGPVRHADTARVNVRSLASPPVLASLSIDPIPPDSSIRSVQTTTRSQLGISFGFVIASEVGIVSSGEGLLLSPRAVDASGGSMSGLAIEYASLDPTIGRVLDKHANVVRLLRPGQLRVVARTTAYGITKSDTAVFTVTLPVATDVAIRQSLGAPPVFDPIEVRIAPHGMVFWRSYLSDTADVTFDAPANAVEPPAAICELMAFLAEVLGPGPGCGIGNVVLPPVAPPPGLFFDESERTLQVRQFRVPGVYTYRSTRTGATGRVVVTADPDQ